MYTCDWFKCTPDVYQDIDMRRSPKSEKNEPKSKDIILVMLIKKENKLSHKKVWKRKTMLKHKK